MKAYHFQADANIALRRPHDAVHAAKSAYGLCLAYPKKFGRDATGTCELVLRAKKALWETRERERVRGLNQLLDECLGAIRDSSERREAELRLDADKGRIGPQTLQEEVTAIRAETQAKEQTLRNVFAAEDPDLQHRVRDFATPLCKTRCADCHIGSSRVLHRPHQFQLPNRPGGHSTRAFLRESAYNGAFGAQPGRPFDGYAHDSG